jgi:hypothetical protein
MKHTVLISAHRSPALLTEVIDAMSTSRTHVFVHIDSTASFTPGDVLPTLAAPARVTMLEPRSAVHWRSYSYLSVVLRLLRAAGRCYVSSVVSSEVSAPPVTLAD